MCGRFELDAKAEVFKKRYKLKRPPAMPNTPEVRPTDLSVVVNGKREAVLLGWGFPSEWDGKPLFNARAETLADKPSFCPYLEQRCIVPATAFFEWRKDGKDKLRNSISLDQSMMSFAGLCSETHFTIITCSASPTMARVHDRMPVILPAVAEDTWLDASLPFVSVSEVLVPYAGSDLCFDETPAPVPPQGDLFG